MQGLFENITLELNKAKTELQVLRSAIEIRENLLALARVPQFVVLMEIFSKRRDALVRLMVSAKTSDEARRELAAEVRTIDLFTSEPTRAEEDLKQLRINLMNGEGYVKEMEARLGTKGGH